MKVLLLSASPHREKSSSFLLAKEVLRGAKDEGASCEALHLVNLKILFCKHCEICHRNILKCPLNDAVSMILNKMMEADGIVLASPNYISQVTALMKTLFDRSAHFIHCKRLLGKYIVAAVTSGSGQNKEVLDYLAFYGRTCGAQFSGGVSAVRQFGEDKNEEAYKLGKVLVSDIKEKKQYAEQIKIIEQGKQSFARIIKLKKDEWKDEYKYWVDQNWDWLFYKTEG